MTIADRLRALRLTAGLSMHGLSELSGLAGAHVRMIEEGDRKNPSHETVRKLARVLGAETDWLGSGEGDGPTERQVKMAVSRARAAAPSKEVA